MSACITSAERTRALREYRAMRNNRATLNRTAQNMFRSIDPYEAMRQVDTLRFITLSQDPNVPDDDLVLQTCNWWFSSIRELLHKYMEYIEQAEPALHIIARAIIVDHFKKEILPAFECVQEAWRDYGTFRITDYNK